jgi:hypothetical protein
MGSSPPLCMYACMYVLCMYVCDLRNWAVPITEARIMGSSPPLCMHACMHACMYVIFHIELYPSLTRGPRDRHYLYACVCMHICVYVCVYVTHTHTNTHTHVCTYHWQLAGSPGSRLCVFECACTFSMYICMYACTCIPLAFYVHMYACTYIPLASGWHARE